MASCVSTSVMANCYEEPVLRRTYGTFEERRRRRHSFYDTRSCAIEHDNIQLLVDRFLSELGRRLDFLESYGQLKFDHSIERAYLTLLAVRDSCSSISSDVLDAGRRRANILVETLEERYKDALATKETLEQKANESVKLMEGLLSEFEARAYAMRDASMNAGQDYFGSSWRSMEESLERAREVVDEGLDKARRAKDSVKETLESTIAEALTRARETGLIRYEDLPEPWRVNPHILSGYRFHEGKLDCVRSVLTVSNEMFNIWSHALGLVLVLAMAFYFYPASANFGLSTKSDVFVAAVFFFAACKCLVCSTMWHTMNSIAEKSLLDRFACVDYTGISLLVAASIMTTEYTAFYCEPVSRWVYMVTTALLGIGGVILPWHPFFNRMDMAWARVLFYVTLAMTGFIPVAQLVMSRGVEWAFYFYAPITKSLLVYITGAVLYASKTPERYFPGMFDYVGGSHNLWHVAVIGGIFFHYLAMQEFFSKAFQRAQTHCSVY